MFLRAACMGALLLGFLEGCSPQNHPFGSGAAGAGAGTGAGSSSTGGAGSTGGAAGTCTDHQRNGTESDQDCGGKDCPRCALGKGCNDTTDCQTSLVCDSTSHCCAPIACGDAECPIDTDGCGTTLDCSKTQYY